MKEIQSLFGASIESRESGGASLVKEKKESHFSVFEVDKDGVVISKDPIKIIIFNEEKNGVRILHKDYPNAIKPGEQVELKIGDQTLTVKANSEKPITLNGEKAEKLTPELRKVMDYAPY